MPSSVLLRRARHDEGATIADVQTRSWQQTYSRDLPTDALSALRFDPRTWSDRIAEAEKIGSKTSIWVAELDDAVVGFAACGPDLADPSVGQLYSIYVLAQAQGTGVGRRLHVKVLEALQAAGFTEVTLWVLRTNAAAIRFYEIADWRPDGTIRVDHFAGLELPEVHYRRPLGRTTDDY